MTHSIPSLLTYPGSKVRHAPWILSFFPKQVHSLEASRGPGAVFLAQDPSPHEVLNDLDGSLVHFLTVVRTRAQELAEERRSTPWSETEYHAIERISVCDDPLEHARRFAIRWWQAHGVRFTWMSGWRHTGLNGHSYPARSWKQVPEGILLAADQLCDDERRQRPARELLRSYNAQDVLLSLDPPYPFLTRKDTLYSHEMSDDDHLELLQTGHASENRILLSSDENALSSTRLTEWGEQRETMAATAEHGRARTDVLWINPRAARTQQLPLFGGVA